MARKRRRRGAPPKQEREVTTVGSQLVSWQLPGNSNKFEMMSPDDLLTRRGWSVYREMTADDQVKAALWYKKTLIAARPFDIVPASDSDEDKKVAQFVVDNLQDIAFRQMIWEMLSAFEFGFSAGELIWRFDEEEEMKLKLKTIKFRDPEWMWIRVNRHGDIIEFVQKPPMSFENDRTREIIIKPEKMMHYAYQRQFSNHYGISDLRSAYRAWWSKKYITQFWNVFLERFGAPLMKMTYPHGASEGLKSSLKQIMTNLSAKTDILVPEGVVIDLIEATRAGTAKYDDALTHYDIRIATALLMPALLGMGTDIKRGSDSQSRLHLRTLMKVIQHIGDEIAQEVNDKIIHQIVDANFNVKKDPKFIFQDYGEFEAFEITDAIKELWTAGILDLDQEDINFARSILGLNLRDEDNEDEVNRPDPSMLPPAPGGDAQTGGKGAKQGNDRAVKTPSTEKTDKTGKSRPSRRK